jgi:hypothetical protein
VRELSHCLVQPSLRIERALHQSTPTRTTTRPRSSHSWFHTSGPRAE